MKKLEMLNAMFAGTQYERNIKIHMKASKERIEECYGYWVENSHKAGCLAFINAVL